MDIVSYYQGTLLNTNMAISVINEAVMSSWMKSITTSHKEVNHSHLYYTFPH